MHHVLYRVKFKLVNPLGTRFMYNVTSMKYYIKTFGHTACIYEIKRVVTITTRPWYYRSRVNLIVLTNRNVFVGIDPDRSVHMRLYSMNKREFVMVFIVLLTAMGLVLFIGLTGELTISFK